MMLHKANALAIFVPSRTFNRHIVRIEFDLITSFHIVFKPSHFNFIVPATEANTESIHIPISGKISFVYISVFFYASDQPIRSTSIIVFTHKCKFITENADYFVGQLECFKYLFIRQLNKIIFDQPFQIYLFVNFYRLYKNIIIPKFIWFITNENLLRNLNIKNSFNLINFL